MPVLADHRHGKRSLVGIQLLRTMAKNGIHGQHIVEGRQAESALWLDVQAEVLRVSVCCGEEPEQDLRPEESLAVAGFG